MSLDQWAITYTLGSVQTLVFSSHVREERLTTNEFTGENQKVDNTMLYLLK